MSDALLGTHGNVKGVDCFDAPPDDTPAPIAPQAMVAPPTERRMVLTGRRYSMMSTTWSEWADKTFDQVMAEMGERRGQSKAKDSPDEIIEIIVVRSATIRTEVISVEETTNG